MLICLISIFYAYLFPYFFWGTNIQQREDLSKQWADFILFEQKKPVLLLGGEAGTGLRHSWMMIG